MRLSRPLNVAVVGLGVGEQHARAYVRHPQCKLRWLLDFDESKVARLASDLGSGRKADKFDDLVADSELDLVSLASFDDHHFQQVIELLNARKHVFVEKPLCQSLEELRAVERAWREAGGAHLAANLVLRAAPLYRWLRQAVQSGEFGEIYAFDGEYLYGRLHKVTDGWRGQVTDYSVIQSGGVHLVDLMMWITGLRPSKVSAAGNRICTAGTEFKYNDFAAATFQFSSGLIGRITANFGCVHRHQHIVRVFGTKGTFVYDDQGARLHTSRDPEKASQPLEFSPLPATKGDLIPDFVDAILAKQDRSRDTRHEFDVVSACVAADHAMKTANTVEVTYL